MLNRISGRYGRRGAFLIIMGATWCAFGLSVFAQPPAEPRPWVLYDYAPAPLEAAWWWVTGIVAIWQGLRGPDGHDWLGHVALYALPAVRVISFAVSWVLWCATTVLTDLGVTNEVIGWEGGWYAALVWSLVSLMLRLVAEWPNPVPPIPRPPTDPIGGP